MAPAAVAAPSIQRQLAWLTLGGLALLGGISCEPAQSPRVGERLIPAADPAIRYTGRWDRSDANHPQASWPGFALSTQFCGTTLQVLMRDEGNFYNVWIDGKLHAVFQASLSGQTHQLLASGLSAGTHQLLLRRRNISFGKPTIIDGFIADAAATLTLPPEKSGPRLEFIGDSFTVAEGNEATVPTLSWEQKQPLTHFDLGFAATIARAYNAEFTAVCRSGAGLVCDWKGNRAAPMAERYGWALMEQPQPAWRFAGPPPELVVICLGLNDFSGLKAADGEVSEARSAEFRQAYHRLIGKVRAQAPQAAIVALAAPKPWLLANIQQVVAAEHVAGHGRIHFASFDLAPEECVADGHPSVAAHQRIAQQVIAQLVALKVLAAPPGSGRLERDPGFIGEQRSLEPPPAQPRQQQR
jgi:Carbohydrate esterase 2 N-terminal/GDSL-like Lipase/Acylhydrolase family